MPKPDLAPPAPSDANSPEDTAEFCVVITTVASETAARKLAQAVVQARLGACVQVQAIHSFYLWEGQSCAEAEFLLQIKTRRALYVALEDFIRAQHDYETPEIIQLPIHAGSADYLAWVRQQTVPPPAPSTADAAAV